MRRYEECATRLENRGWHPPSRAYVDELVEGLLASGVEASWHSAVSQDCLPLFPSAVLPVCHPQASLEAFRYLLDRLHGIGRPVLSWISLNHSAPMLERHPDWRMQLLPVPGLQPNAQDAHNICPNSPYSELLPRFMAEIVEVVGFDGIWVDGSTYSDHATSPGYQPGCVCARCRDRFRRDTGRALPEIADFDNPDFRVWVTWRYDVLMDLWRRCVEAVHAVNPDALVCFNNYRRRTGHALSWGTGIPMRRLDWDAMMSGELDNFPGQADIQMKINQAYGMARGVESWWPLCDHWNLWVPDHEPLTAVQAALGCVSAGGVACTGVGVSAKTMAYVLREMEDAAAPRMPYLGGETVEYAGILASQATMDFYAEPHDAWDGIHGANEFCRHAHLQSSVLFDDDLARDLSRYPVLLLGNAACVSAAGAAGLEAYVRAGGVLVACHEAGTRDALGYPHPVPVLDGLLGIRSRAPGQGAPTLEIAADRQADAGPYVSFQGAHTAAAPAADVTLIAQTVERTDGGWDGQETGAAPFRRVPGLWLRRVGQGTVLYAGVDYFLNYLRTPTAQMRRLLRALLVGLRPPRVTLDGPICVTVNTRIQPDGSWAVHLHNAPGTAYAYPNPPRNVYLHAPGEVVPVHDLRLHLTGARFARSGLTGTACEVRDDVIHIPRVKLQEVVVVEME